MMRLIAALMLAVSSAGCATTMPDAPPPSIVTAAPIVIGEALTLDSGVMGASRAYNVRLPDGYEAGETAYPVVYLLDGGLAQDFVHIAGLMQYADLSGAFRPAILVGVETVDRRAELTAASSDPKERADFPTHGEAARFRRFLREELAPEIERRYRTNGERMIIGESLAGLFVAETFLAAPDAFDGYAAISPSLWWDGGSLAARADMLLALHEPDARRLYLAIADESGLMREGVLRIVRSLESRKVGALAWAFADRPDLTHATIYHREALEALVFLLPPPSTAE